MDPNMNDRTLVLLPCLLFAPACVGDSNAANDGGADSSADTTVVDAPAIDSPSSNDVANDVVVDAGTTYNDITDKSKWETIDLASLTSGNTGYLGGTFDGKYVYYSPNQNSAPFGLLIRYDISKAFATTSFEKLDLAQTNAAFVGFDGAVFAGTKIYFSPYSQHSLVAYDTTKPFASGSSYAGFDLVANVDPNAYSFAAAGFDGKYAYLTPYFGGLVVRYDTAATFDAGASYEKYQLYAPNTYGFNSMNYDGKYMYFAPYAGPTLVQFSGKVQRYDTAKAFNSAASWLAFDVSAIDTNAVGFGCSVYDGRYFYLVPHHGTLVLRYDTQAQFDTAASWTKFDLVNVNSTLGNFAGATFDGRYIYFSPENNGVTVRYDTTQAFGATPSWQPFDMTTKDAAAKNYIGLVFDGRYVYYVPYGGTVAARFDAKSPPSLPPFQSSFY